jgi:hypothetical protein
MKRLFALAVLIATIIFSFAPISAQGTETDSNCPSLPARLILGQNGQSIRDGTGPTRVRPNPGVGEPILEIQEGDTFLVIDGYECRVTQNGERMRFFLIETNSGQQGWIPEASDQRYFMEPMANVSNDVVSQDTSNLQSSIVGTWDPVSPDTLAIMETEGSITFYADGKVFETFSRSEGSYRFISANEIEFDVISFIEGSRFRQVYVQIVALNGDIMTLTNEYGTVIYYKKLSQSVTADNGETVLNNTDVVGRIQWTLNDNQTGEILASGDNLVTREDIKIEQFIDENTGEVRFQKYIALHDGFVIGIFISPIEDLSGGGFGLWLQNQDAQTFSWDWFSFQNDSIATKAVGAGQIDYELTTTNSRQEIGYVTFLTDVVLRAFERNASTLNPPRWTVTISEGSYVNWASVQLTTEAIDFTTECTFTVSGGDTSQLISAIESANGDNSIDKICLDSGTYQLALINNSNDETGPNVLPVIVSQIIITGDNSDNTILNGGGIGRIFKIAPGGNLTLSNLTLTGGMVSNVNPNLPGGAILNQGILTITDSTLSGNSAGVGGVIANDGTVTITDTTISGNGARGSGCIENAGMTTITDSVLSDNHGPLGGGCIGNSGTLSITNSVISNNSADFGGGIANYTGGRVTIASTVLFGNTADFYEEGSAIHNNNGTVEITESCMFDNNGISVYSVNERSRINAANNWWGASDGPSGIASGSGDAVSPNVDFGSFLDTSTCHLLQPTETELFQQIVYPPYDSCVANATYSESPEYSGVSGVLAHGFSKAVSTCDAEKGTINHIVMLFGGTENPIYRADGHSDIEFEFTPPFTGTLRIEAQLLANANLGVAGGPSLVSLPNFRDIVAEFVLPDAVEAILAGVINIFNRGGGAIEASAYVQVFSDKFEQETTVTIGGDAFVAQFPPVLGGAMTLSRSFTSEQINVSLEVPVTQGQTLSIVVGTRIKAQISNWAVAHWNFLGQDSSITFVTLTQVQK